jgi:hypothetical protein
MSWTTILRTDDFIGQECKVLRNIETTCSLVIAPQDDDDDIIKGLNFPISGDILTALQFISRMSANDSRTEGINETLSNVDAAMLYISHVNHLLRFPELTIHGKFLLDIIDEIKERSVFLHDYDEICNMFQRANSSYIEKVSELALALVKMGQSGIYEAMRREAIIQTGLESEHTKLYTTPLRTFTLMINNKLFSKRLKLRLLSPFTSNSHMIRDKFLGITFYNNVLPGCILKLLANSGEYALFGIKCSITDVRKQTLIMQLQIDDIDKRVNELAHELRQAKTLFRAHLTDIFQISFNKDGIDSSDESTIGRISFLLNWKSQLWRSKTYRSDIVSEFYVNLPGTINFTIKVNQIPELHGTSHDNDRAPDLVTSDDKLYTYLEKRIRSYMAKRIDVGIPAQLPLEEVRFGRDGLSKTVINEEHLKDGDTPLALIDDHRSVRYLVTRKDVLGHFVFRRIESVAWSQLPITDG